MGVANLPYALYLAQTTGKPVGLYVLLFKFDHFEGQRPALGASVVMAPAAEFLRHTLPVREPLLLRLVLEIAQAGAHILPLCCCFTGSARSASSTWPRACAGRDEEPAGLGGKIGING